MASDSSQGAALSNLGFWLPELNTIACFFTLGEGGDYTQNCLGSGHFALPLFGFSFYSSLRLGLRFELKDSTSKSL